MIRFRTHRIQRVSLAILVIGYLSFQSVAIAETLPTIGTFDGVYHRDRWSVGHYVFFIVHPGLHEKLAKYEGKFIRLTVTKGTQPTNPGPAIMLDVGKIEELPQPPLSVSAKTKPINVTKGEPFQIVVEITNESKDGLLLYPVLVISTIRQPSIQPGQRPNEPSPLINGYTMDQLSVGEERIQMGEWETFQGHPNLESQGGSILLLPGASYAWVTSIVKGGSLHDGELKIEVSYALAEPKASYGASKSYNQYEAWQAFPVQQAKPENVATAQDEKVLAVSNIDLTAEEDGWSSFRFKLLPAKGRKVRIPGTINRATGKVDSEKYAHVGRLHGSAADGSVVEIQGMRLPERDTPDGIAQLLDLPEAGVAISGRFRKQSRFAPPVAQVSLSLLTDSGIETVILFNEFKDLDVAPPTPFGPPTGGVKARIRPAKATFKQGEPLRFHLEAVNVAGKPVCWWRPFNGLGENIVIEIDGARIKQPESRPECCDGWATERTCANPVEWTVTLPESVTFARGKHALRYTIVSTGGKYKNSNNQMIPLVRGRIVTEKASFSVE